jgi:hypothetical protein
MSHPSVRAVGLIVTASEPVRMWDLPALVRISALAIASATITDAAPERFPDFEEIGVSRATAPFPAVCIRRRFANTGFAL